MKTPDDVIKAGKLLKAFRGIEKVRDGISNPGNKAKFLQLCGFDGDEDGGSFHGESLIPIDLSENILNFIESELRNALFDLEVRV